MYLCNLGGAGHKRTTFDRLHSCFLLGKFRRNKCLIPIPMVSSTPGFHTCTGGISNELIVRRKIQKEKK